MYLFLFFFSSSFFIRLSKLWISVALYTDFGSRAKTRRLYPDFKNKYLTFTLNTELAQNSHRILATLILRSICLERSHNRIRRAAFLPC